MVTPSLASPSHIKHTSFGSLFRFNLLSHSNSPLPANLLTCRQGTWTGARCFNESTLMTCSSSVMAANVRKRVSQKPAAPNGTNKPNPTNSDEATLLQKAKIRVLLLFDELPEWAKDNEHIHSGWRPETNSYTECIRSMCYIHNETGNIYSHLLAAVWMILLGSWWSLYANDHYPATGSDDAIVFFLFFLGGTVCYLLSTAYHLLSNHSQATHLFCLKLDFLGILTVTAGCFPPGLWYTFPCASRKAKCTWIAVSVLLF